MGRRAFWVWLTVVISAAVSLYALIYLPEQIPAQYDFKMNVTRYGSKLETLIFPFTALATAVSWHIADAAAREGRGKKSAEALFWSCFLTLLALTVISVAFVLMAQSRVKGYASPISVIT